MSKVYILNKIRNRSKNNKTPTIKISGHRHQNFFSFYIILRTQIFCEVCCTLKLCGMTRLKTTKTKGSLFPTDQLFLISYETTVYNSTIYLLILTTTYVDICAYTIKKFTLIHLLFYCQQILLDINVFHPARNSHVLASL